MILAVAAIGAIACSEEPAAGDATATIAIETATLVATSTSVPEPTATATPVPLPTAEPVRPNGVPFPASLKTQARGVLDKLGEVRGAPAKGDIDMFLLSRSAARAYYGGAPLPDGSSQDRPVDVKQELYELLGLVPPPQPRPGGPSPTLGQQSLDYLISQITGFYSEDLNAFYLLDDLGGLDSVQSRQTVVHELVHALQDQYYDFGGTARARANDWDGYRALLDVMEGDAVGAEIAYFGYSTHRAPQCFVIPPASRSDVAFVVEREQNTWYEDGLCFVNAVAPQLPNGVSGIWERPPTTTEQILHPDKYLAREGAIPVVLPSLDITLGGGWSKLAQSSLGEFTVQHLLLIGSLPRDRVWQAAAGWGGDNFAMYMNGDARLVHASIAWDSAAEAREFWDAFVESMGNRASGRQPPLVEGAYRAEIDGVGWRAVLLNDRVTFLASDDPAALERAATSLGMP